MMKSVKDDVVTRMCRKYVGAVETGSMKWIEREERLNHFLISFHAHNLFRTKSISNNPVCRTFQHVYKRELTEDWQTIV